MLARRARAAATLAAGLALIAVLVPAAASATGQQRTLRGSVPIAGMNVALFAAQPGGGGPALLGRTRSRRGGAFALRYRAAARRTVKYLLATRPGGAAEAGFPVPGGSYRLASALGAGPVPPRASANERTTVAIGYAMAQFVADGRVAGENPGLRNAVAMTRNLVLPRSGRLSPVLRSFPNGNSTTTLRTVGSLANLLALCRVQGPRCAQLLRLASVPGAAPSGDTLAATVALARYPWHNTGALLELARRARNLFPPSLPARRKLDAWTLALRFEGSPRGLDGPGNIAVDRRGSLWVGNNYVYSRESLKPTCFGRELLRFTPTGRTFPGSPYRSGGASGVGFGIGIDKNDHVWTGNFGFSGRGCDEEPPHNSVSEYEADGTALSPNLRRTGTTENEAGEILKTYKGGWEVGDIFWPQATVADVHDNIWVANCGNESVTRIPNGDPQRAINYPQRHFERPGFGWSRPFGIATDAAGNAYVGGNNSATVVKLGRYGEVLDRFQGGGLHRPLGLATDSRGNVWVSNSTWIVAPCVGQFRPERGPRKGGSMTLITNKGDVSKASPYRNGGIKNAWGVAVDGDDNVWVANFSGRRLSALCGARPRNCPAGKRQVGASISPPASGYGFNGLTRVTGLALDPSGNVWMANNWKNAPVQTNPGGYQIVAFLGLAAPVRTPLIGAPEQP